MPTYIQQSIGLNLRFWVGSGQRNACFLTAVPSRMRTLDWLAFGILSPKIGTAVVDRELVANAGRMLNVTTLGTYTTEAPSSADEAVDKVNFKNGFCRRVIGRSEIERAKS